MEGLEDYLEGECPRDLVTTIVLFIKSARTQREPEGNNIEDKEVINNKNLKFIFVVDLPTHNDEKSRVLEKLTSLDVG